MSDVCILLINLDNNLDTKKFTDFVNLNFLDSQVIIASREKHQLSGKMTEYVFETKNPDIVINSLIKKVDAKTLIIVRKTDNDFSKIITVYKGLKKDNQICILKKKTNKFVAFFSNLRNKVMKSLFNYTFLDGSLECVGFSKLVIDVLIQLDNSSMYTKIDKWSGIEINEIEVDSIDKVKFKPKITKNCVRIGFEIIAFLAPLLVWIFVDFIKKSISLKLLFVFIMLLGVCLCIFDIFLICAKYRIGENTYEKAEYIENN